LGLDVGGALLPVVTGVGAAARAGSVVSRADNVADKAYTVYVGYDEAGVVKYVGHTSRPPEVRWAEHGRAVETGREKLNYRVYQTDLGSKVEALGIEQSLIDKYGLRRKGGQLLNERNAIAQPPVTGGGSTISRGGGGGISGGSLRASGGLTPGDIAYFQSAIDSIKRQIDALLGSGRFRRR
jgi:hypothetical protein